MLQWIVCKDVILNVSNVCIRKENYPSCRNYDINFVNGNNFIYKRYTDENERDRKFEQLKIKLKYTKDNILDLDKVL